MAETSIYSETEERIFEAALRLFARKGKDGARMQEIADAAGINKAMLHYYFRSKNQLYEEVFGYVFRRFMLSFGAAMRETETFEAFLHAFIDSYIDFVREHLDVIRLMVNENLAGGPAMGQHLQAAMAASESVPPRLFIERLTAAIDAGEVRPVDPHHTLLSVISCCIFSFITLPTVRLLVPGADDLDALVAARKQHVFELVYAGLKPRSTAS